MQMLQYGQFDAKSTTAKFCTTDAIASHCNTADAATDATAVTAHTFLPSRKMECTKHGARLYYEYIYNAAWLAECSPRIWTYYTSYKLRQVCTNEQWQAADNNLMPD